MDTAWTQILSKTLSLGEENEMRVLFNDTDCLEKRQFSPIHDIVLGLKKGNVETEALMSSSFINSGDSNGRTPLSWAASRGDFKIVGSLIRLGANPNLISVCDMSPLHFAMRPTSPRCIVPLLAAGAKVDQLSDWQQTPLHHAASYQDDIRFLEPLIDSGAEVNARDRDGNTPLGCAALQNHPRSAAFLLDCGADIDSQTPSGWNALLMSVDCNSHAALRLLLQRGADPTLKLSTGCTILHRVAERGDIKTIEILTAARLKEVDINAVNSENCTARDLIRRRDQISVEFVASFETLLKSIQPRVFEQGETHESDEDDAAQFADAEEYLI